MRTRPQLPASREGLEVFDVDDADDDDGEAWTDLPAGPDAQGATWQGEDGRAYCRRSDGTTGLVVGGGAGALIGREIGRDGRQNRRRGRGGGTAGAIIGGLIGAIVGSAVERSASEAKLPLDRFFPIKGMAMGEA